MKDQASNSNQTSQADNRIKKDVKASGVQVGRVYKGLYNQDGELTAEIRQEINTVSSYPSKQISNSMSDNIFGQEDFSQETHKPTEYTNVEKRVAWLTVPEDSDEKSVTEKLKTFANASLFKVLSNHPILTEEQRYAISSGVTTKDIISESQVVKIPTNDKTEQEGTANNIVLDPTGKVQYRSVFFSADGTKEDDDRRNPEPTDFYLSSSIETELNAQLEDDSTTIGDTIPGQRL